MTCGFPRPQYNAARGGENILRRDKREVLSNENTGKGKQYEHF